MKIAIVGPGAMGCLFSALLTEAGHEVWLLDRSVDRASEIVRSGIHIEGIGGPRTVRPKATDHADDIGAVDLVFIWVKAYDTASAVQSIAPTLAEHTGVVSLQNGLGNIETIAQVVNPRNVIGGITSHGSTLLGVGSIRHAGKGDTVIGRMHGQVDGRLRQAADLLSAADIETGISQDIETTIWSKLIVNAAINPLTAITRLRNGQLLESKETRRLLDLVAAESEAIVAHTGVSLSYPDIKKQIYSVCRATAQNRSSMLQDMLCNRQTEIDAINGALVEKADALNIRAPVNEMLTYLVRALERGGDRDR